ncbi:hypothetical protein Taro_042952 [Colocasia esculenta]|uniref:Uncharacterized protein n=1 Tax=Colocasia esculenta TaxID=4460 RepID=A0A843X0J4_COLES|nr:hypothetical protein [Colocasia esculenta]
MDSHMADEQVVPVKYPEVSVHEGEMLLAHTPGYKFHAGITGRTRLGRVESAHVSSPAHVVACAHVFPRPTIMKTASIVNNDYREIYN